MAQSQSETLTEPSHHCGRAQAHSPIDKSLCRLLVRHFSEILSQFFNSVLAFNWFIHLLLTVLMVDMRDIRDMSRRIGRTLRHKCFNLIALALVSAGEQWLRPFHALPSLASAGDAFPVRVGHTLPALAMSGLRSNAIQSNPMQWLSSRSLFRKSKTHLL